jgi:hypothetical protein
MHLLASLLPEGMILIILTPMMVSDRNTVTSVKM